MNKQFREDREGNKRNEKKKRKESRGKKEDKERNRRRGKDILGKRRVRITSRLVR